MRRERQGDILMLRSGEEGRRERRGGKVRSHRYLFDRLSQNWYRNIVKNYMQVYWSRDTCIFTNN